MNCKISAEAGVRGLRKGRRLGGSSGKVRRSRIVAARPVKGRRRSARRVSKDTPEAGRGRGRVVPSGPVGDPSSSNGSAPLAVFARLEP